MSVARDPNEEPIRAAIQDEAIVDNLDLLLACLPGEIVAAIRDLATREELAAGRDGLSRSSWTEVVALRHVLLRAM